MVLKSNEWVAPIETSQTTVRLKSGKVRTLFHAKAASDVRNVEVTQVLNDRYVSALPPLKARIRR